MKALPKAQQSSLMPGYNVFGDGMFFGEGLLKGDMIESWKPSIEFDNWGNPLPTASAATVQAWKASKKAEKLEELETVSRAVTLASFVPEDQQDKLDVLDDLSFFLEPALHDAKAPVVTTTAGEIAEAMKSLERVVAAELAAAPAQSEEEEEYRSGLERLGEAVRALTFRRAADL